MLAESLLSVTHLLNILQLTLYLRLSPVTHYLNAEYYCHYYIIALVLYHKSLRCRAGTDTMATNKRLGKVLT